MCILWSLREAVGNTNLPSGISYLTLQSPCIFVEHQLSIDGMSKKQLLLSTELLKRSEYFSRVSVSVGAQSYQSV
jgi:hypothetical protein